MRMSNHKKWMKEGRAGEKIGGGYFVMRRGDGTGRIRPTYTPYEHATIEAAIAEASRLAQSRPGYRFEVMSCVGTYLVEPVDG
jgi:hypothetical protein